MFAIFNNTMCAHLTTGQGSPGTEISVGVKGSLEINEAFWLILGFGVFASLLAFGFSAIRKHIYKDKVRDTISKYTRNIIDSREYIAYVLRGH